MGDRVLGEKEKWASAKRVEVLEVVQLIGGFGKGEEVGVNGLDLPGLIIGSHGIPPYIPMHKGEGVSWGFRFLFEEVVFYKEDEEDGEEGKGEEEAGEFGLLLLSGKDSGENENCGNKGTGKKEEYSGEPVAILEDFTDEPSEEEEQDEGCGDS